MKRVLCLLLALVCMTSVCLATVSDVDPNAYYTVQISAVPVDDILAVADGAQLDKLLYPTGMQLPTKYLDLLVFADTGDREWIVTGRVYQFLKTFYPTEGDRYTFAECRAAQMFCAWHDTLYSSDRSFADLDVSELLLLDEVLNLDSDVATVVPYDVQSLQQTIAGHREVLDQPGLGSSDITLVEGYDVLTNPSGDSLVYSLGYDFMWDAYYNISPTEELSAKLEKFYSSREEYCQTLGLSWQATHTSYYNGDGSYIGAAVVQAPSVGAPPDEELGFAALPTETPEVTPEQTTPVESEVPKTTKPAPSAHIDYDDVEANKTITEFANGLTDSDSTHKAYSVRDITVAVALCIVLVAVVAFGISDWLKKRNDPTRRYRR